MRTHGLLIIGVGAIAASLLIGVVGVSSGWITGWSMDPGKFLGGAKSGQGSA